MKPLTPTERKDIIQAALFNNHDRVTLLGDVRLVRFAFLVNDPEGRKVLKPEQSIEHGKRLKSLIRVYLNKYRRRRSGKRVMGYSWVMHSEQYLNKPYLHIVFYVSPDTYDEIIPEPRNEVQVMSSDAIDKNTSEVDTREPKRVSSVIADLGYYWTVVCKMSGVSGAAINYNLEKGRNELSHGEHQHINQIREAASVSKMIITEDINGGDFPLVKLNVEVGKEKGYLRSIAREAYFLPSSRSFGVSYRGKKQVSENEPLTIPETDAENGIKKPLNDN